MKEITRREADQMIQHIGVHSTKVEQDHDELHVSLRLVNNHVLVVSYYRDTQKKRYTLKKCNREMGKGER